MAIVSMIQNVDETTPATALQPGEKGDFRSSTMPIENRRPSQSMSHLQHTIMVRVARHGSSG